GSHAPSTIPTRSSIAWKKPTSSPPCPASCPTPAKWLPELHEFQGHCPPVMHARVHSAEGSIHAAGHPVDAVAHALPHSQLSGSHPDAHLVQPSRHFLSHA